MMSDTARAERARQQRCPSCHQPALQWHDTVRMTPINAVPGSPPLDLDRLVCHACGFVWFWDLTVVRQIAADGPDLNAPAQ